MLQGRRRDSGQELVEFALVFPVLMLLVLGIIEVGRIMYSYNAIANAAREGARWAVVPGPLHQDQIQSVTEPCPGTNEIIRQVCSHALALSQSDLQVTVSQPESDTVQIQVVYTGPFLTNLIQQALGQGDLELRAAATMQLE